ncbi:hypothetical protein BC832DRAFT_210332 [Gaertneriomyces semiglobifer]|nr:hypothetical protein BC832DRAFT_210332 [Gaertneriomyces semiglobifer]
MLKRAYPLFCRSRWSPPHRGLSFWSSLFSRPTPSEGDGNPERAHGSTDATTVQTSTFTNAESTDHSDNGPLLTRTRPDMLARDREYLDKLLDMEGGISGVELENGEPVGLKRQVKADMKRVI